MTLDEIKRRQPYSPQLDQYRTLQPNWDGYGALPIDPLTIYNADCIWKPLEDEGFEPTCCPMSNGCIMLEWVCEGREFTLEIGKTLISGLIDHTTQDKDHGQQAKDQGGTEACD